MQAIHAYYKHSMDTELYKYKYKVFLYLRGNNF